MFTFDVLAMAWHVPGLVLWVHTVLDESGPILKISDDVSCILFWFLAMAC